MQYRDVLLILLYLSRAYHVLRKIADYTDTSVKKLGDSFHSFLCQFNDLYC